MSSKSASNVSSGVYLEVAILDPSEDGGKTLLSITLPGFPNFGVSAMNSNDQQLIDLESIVRDCAAWPFSDKYVMASFFDRMAVILRDAGACEEANKPS